MIITEVTVASISWGEGIEWITGQRDGVVLVFLIFCGVIRVITYDYLLNNIQCFIHISALSSIPQKMKRINKLSKF